MEILQRCAANDPPLSPIRFIERAAIVYGDSTSIVYNSTRYTWSHTYQRCRRLASALSAHNILPHDVVSVVAPNIPAIYEMHFAVPMAGVVLHTVDTLLDARTMAAQFNHCQPKVVFADYQFEPLVTEAIRSSNHKPNLVIIEELGDGREIVPKSTATATTYEGLLQGGDPEFKTRWPEDEWQSIVLNYTSGATSGPKGVVHSHRGIYLMVVDALLTWGMKPRPVYLWTLPMFHSNGWCFPWGIAAVGGTNICLRECNDHIIYKALNDHQVTHLCVAPPLLTMIANSESERTPLPHRVEILTGGSPPPADVLRKIEELGFCVTHGYGLTETAGLVVSCAWKSEWDILAANEMAQMKARQGVRSLGLAELDVKDPGTMASVARDGVKVGEVMMRGPSIMKGYFKDEKRTGKAMKGGWFHTGDVGVIHPDGYLEIKYRSKDFINSGRRKFRSMEVESMLCSHPMVVEAAVVVRSDHYGGTTLCAFVSTRGGSGSPNRSGVKVTEAEMISFCRKKLRHHMVPKHVVFMESLPKSCTGKIRKSLLKEMAKKPLHKKREWGKKIW